MLFKLLNNVVVYAAKSALVRMPPGVGMLAFFCVESLGRAVRAAYNGLAAVLRIEKDAVIHRAHLPQGERADTFFRGYCFYSRSTIGGILSPIFA
jgi:hypothetical protein